MPVFEYKATDANGQPLNGTLLSGSLVAAAEELSKKGMTVQHLAVATSAYDPIPQEFAHNAPIQPVQVSVPIQPPKPQKQSPSAGA